MSAEINNNQERAKTRKTKSHESATMNIKKIALSNNNFNKEKKTTLSKVINLPINLESKGIKYLINQIRAAQGPIIFRRQANSEHFCLGMTLEEDGFGNAGWGSITEEFLEVARQLEMHSMPIISVVEGACRGGGMLFPSLSSIVLATDKASFGFPEVRRGGLPGLVSVAAQRRLSRADCEWLMLTGDRVDAMAAQRLGLVNFVGDDVEIEKELSRIERRFARIGSDLLSMCRENCPAPNEELAAITMGRLAGRATERSWPKKELVNVYHDVQFGVAIIELADPETFNCIDMPISEDFRRAISTIRSLTDLKVVILQGEGRHFCAGGNPDAIRSMVKSQPSLELAAHIFDIYNGFASLRDLDVPVICVAHGHVVGGGLAAALNADYRLAAVETTFNFGNLPRGLCPGLLLSESLERVVGARWASELYLRDHILTADRALDIGLIQEVAPTATETKERALELARTIAAHPRTGLVETLRLTRRPKDLSRLARESLAIARCITSGQIFPSPAKYHQEQKVETAQFHNSRVRDTKDVKSSDGRIISNANEKKSNTVGVDDVGIVAMEIYTPDAMIPQTEIEQHHDANGKYTIGLKQDAVSVSGVDEDAVSMALTAVHSLLERYEIGFDQIGRLEVATESQVDLSKSIKTHLMQLFEESGNCNIEGVDTYNACYGGTAALFNTIAWCESSAWDGRYGLVVCTDISVTKEDDMQFGGAAAVAMLVGTDAALVLLPERASCMLHRWDFYKPIGWHEPYPIVLDGKYSVDLYLHCLEVCRDKLANRIGEGMLRCNDFFAFHGPHAYLAWRGFSQLVEYEAPDMSSRERIEAYDREVSPSTELVRAVGSVYTASVFLGLYSLVLNVKDDLVGKNVCVFSYGSGASSSLYRFAVRRLPLIDWSLPRRLAARRPVSFANASTVCADRTENYGRFGYFLDGSEAHRSGVYYLRGIDRWGRRSYQRCAGNWEANNTSGHNDGELTGGQEYSL